MGTLFAILLLLGGLAGGATLAEQGISNNATEQRKQNLRNWLYENYPDLTPAQVEALVEQYGDKGGSGPWDVSAYGDQTRWQDLQQELDKIMQAKDDLGEAPEMPSEDDLKKLQEEAFAEIDAENQRLIDLYNQTFQNSETQLQNELRENTSMFGDYRNQVLTNEAMRQQAIAGSTRFELDRQQRNAIVRGASAAQRLVANINTQLGLQAQSAQQSLDTSNALAQNLLAHRQAQQNVRNAYLNAQNQYNRDLANVYSGQAERRYNYGQGRKQGAIDDYNYAYDSWNNRVNDYFQGDSVGRGIYTSTYGRHKNGSSL